MANITKKGVISLFLYASLPAGLTANINRNQLTPNNESVCFSDSTFYRPSHKPSVPPSQLRRIRDQEYKIYREMVLLGYSKEDVIEMLEEDCPTDLHPVHDGSDEYLRKLSFTKITINQIKNEKKSFAQYKDQCSKMGYEALTFEEYNLELEAATKGSSNPFGDFREGWDGWNHTHDCNDSQNSNCTPHHHELKEKGRELAIERLVHRDIMKFRIENSGLSSTTTTKSGGGNLSGTIDAIIAEVELGIDGKYESSTTTDSVTPEALNKFRDESRDKWEQASDDDILAALSKDDGGIVSGNSEPPKPEQPKNEQPKNEQPKNEQPKNEQPKNEQPKNEQPSSDPDPFESATEENPLKLDPTNSTPANNDNPFEVSCGLPINPNDYSKTIDPHVAEEDRKRAEKEAKCQKDHGMSCAEHEKKVNQNIKVDLEIAKRELEKKKQDEKCIKAHGMTCDQYDKYLRENIKFPSQGNNTSPEDPCVSSPHLAWCHSNLTVIPKKDPKNDESQGGSFGTGGVKPKPIKPW
ncbi:MAG: hypothetical protein ACOH5I_23320 [Oligoflexus sp.]